LDLQCQKLYPLLVDLATNVFWHVFVELYLDKLIDGFVNASIYLSFDLKGVGDQ
jgi:hypothetical protein